MKRHRSTLPAARWSVSTGLPVLHLQVARGAAAIEPAVVFTDRPLPRVPNNTIEAATRAASAKNTNRPGLPAPNSTKVTRFPRMYVSAACADSASTPAIVCSLVLT